MLTGVFGPRIVLVGTKESANVGAVARAMLNFGLRDLWLVAPRCRIDDRAYALASHAGEVLDGATVVNTLGEAIADREMVFGTSARGRAADNYRVMAPREAAADLSGASAVLFGPEDHGLSNEDLTRCQAQIVIPTREIASLNLGQAVLLVAYENSMCQPSQAVPKLKPKRSEAEEPASRGQLEGFYRQLSETLLHIGYTDPDRLAGVLRMFRGIIDRAAPTAHDLAALRGLVRQTVWAANQPPELVPGNKSADRSE